MQIEQFVMAYKIEQDRIRALMPNDYESLRPVLRINTEIRQEGNNAETYIEFNTPVAHDGKRGWLNIGNWSSNDTEITCELRDKTTIIQTAFFKLSYTAVGIQGGCPAEKDNDGCFFRGQTTIFKPAEHISEKKEFCDCEFSWAFHQGDACGKSIGKTLPATLEVQERTYPVMELTPENAAAIPCLQVLGTYIVRFKRINCIEEE